jgi:hypothetical protein
LISRTLYAQKKKLFKTYIKKLLGRTHFRTIKAPAITNALPVAQDGIDANIGEKKTEIKNMKPVTMPVIPVLPPSVLISYTRLTDKDKKNLPLIPVALSTKAVTGLVPTRAPILIEKASTQ